MTCPGREFFLNRVLPPLKYLSENSFYNRIGNSEGPACGEEGGGGGGERGVKNGGRGKIICNHHIIIGKPLCGFLGATLQRFDRRKARNV